MTKHRHRDNKSCYYNDQDFTLIYKLNWILFYISQTPRLNCDTMYSVFLNPIFQQWQTCLCRSKKDDERKNISNSVFDLLHDHGGVSEGQGSQCDSVVLSILFHTPHCTWVTFVTRLGKTSKHILSADGEHFRKFIRKLLGKMFQKHLKYQILNMKFLILLLHYLNSS